jgi:flagellar basal body-associated protein FliL
MAATIILGIVIVALGAGTVVYSFWHEGSPLRAPRRRRPHTGHPHTGRPHTG